MWIGTALYHLLKERMDEDDVKLLVQPSVITEDGTELVYDKLIIVPKSAEKKPTKAKLKVAKKA
jgi:hypothetical protein